MRPRFAKVKKVDAAQKKLTLVLLALVIAILLPRVCFGADIVQFSPNLLAVRPAPSGPDLNYPRYRFVNRWIFIVRYPPEDRQVHTPRGGEFILRIDPKSGEVTSITIEKRTGDELLDRVCLKELIALKFKPKTVTNVRVPAMSISGMRTSGPGAPSHLP